MTGASEHTHGLPPGEFGTKLETEGDRAWLHDLSQWINNIGLANDGLHTDVTSFFYWYGPLTVVLRLHPSHHTNGCCLTTHPEKALLNAARWLTRQ